MHSRLRHQPRARDFRYFRHWLLRQGRLGALAGSNKCIRLAPKLSILSDSLRQFAIYATCMIIIQYIILSNNQEP